MFLSALICTSLFSEDLTFLTIQVEANVLSLFSLIGSWKVTDLSTNLYFMNVTIAVLPHSSALSISVLTSLGAGLPDDKQNTSSIIYIENGFVKLMKASKTFFVSCSLFLISDGCSSLCRDDSLADKSARLSVASTSFAL